MLPQPLFIQLKLQQKRNLGPLLMAIQGGYPSHLLICNANAASVVPFEFDRVQGKVDLFHFLAS